VRHFLTIALLVAAPSARGADWRRAWRASLATFAASQAADTASSWGRAEANSLLGQRFGTRALLIKGGATAALCLAQRKWGRGHERPMAIVNFAGTGATAAVAARNWRLK
jgi:hypothetical protein